MAATTAAGQIADPSLRWYRVRTPHFDVHYHQPLGPIAQRTARIAESVHDTLTRGLGFVSGKHVHIVLSDITDGANGSASVAPRPVIRLFVSAPGDMAATGDYDDWMTTLLTHEHAHILHMGEIGGLPAVINALFGTIYAPNSIQPSWFIEGLATYQESKHTSGGRMRATMFDMTLRMDALEDRLPTLAQLSNDPTRFPHAQLRYLYGSRFVAFIAERHGDAALTRMGREYGRQAIPFGLNRIAKRATGHTLDELYAQFIEATRARYRKQQQAIAAGGLREGMPLIPFSDTTRSPRHLPGGRLVYFVSDGHSRGQVRAVGGHEVVRTRTATLAPHPDGRHLVVSMTAPHRDLYSFHELFLHDLVTDERTQLTHGMRAREPDVSPDGGRVTFVTQGGGTSHLEVAQLRDVEGTRRRLVTSPARGQVYTPRFSPDGRRIACSIWREGGYRDIALVDVDTGRVRLVTHDRAMDRGPAFHPDGRYLYFSSDRSGVANIYRHDLETDDVVQITNVLGGAYQPDVHPDGKSLVYVAFRSRGYGIERIALDDTIQAPAAPYVDTRPVRAEVGAGPVYPQQPYSPLPTLPPESYRIHYQPGAFGPELGLSVVGNDVLRFHSYALSAAVALEAGETSANLGYSYTRWRLRPTLRLFRNVSPRSDLIVAGRRRSWVELSTGGSLGASYTVPGLFDRQALSLSYTLRDVDKAEPFGGELDPNDPPPQIPRLGVAPSANLSWSYSDTVQTTYDISRSSGRRIGIGISVVDPIMGREASWVRLTGSIRQYLRVPFTAHHVIAVRYGIGQGGGDARHRARFSIGGFPDVVPLDTLEDLLTLGHETRFGGAALRGFPWAYRSGSQLHLAQLEYRFPLFRPEWGISTLPVYLRRLDALVFGDAGDAFDGSFDADNLGAGVGGELFARLVLTYRVPMSLRLGAARGLTPGGVTQYYMTLGSAF